MLFHTVAREEDVRSLVCHFTQGCTPFERVALCLLGVPTVGSRPNEKVAGAQGSM